MATWLKTFREGNPDSPINSPSDHAAKDEERTFYEPLSRDKHGAPKLTLAGLRIGKPSYEIGDLIGTYWNGSGRVAELWEVIGHPKQSKSALWSWQTQVKFVARIPGVPLEQLDIEPRILGRRIKLHLRGHREAALLKAFGR